MNKIIHGISFFDIGEEIAGRMKPAEMGFDKNQFNHILDVYEKLNDKESKHKILKEDIEHLMNTFPSKDEDWTDAVKHIAKRILCIGIKDIEQALFIEDWLSNFAHIFENADDETRSLYGQMLKVKIADAYTVSRPTRWLITLMQLLNAMDITIIEDLVNDSLDKWTDEEFNSLLPYIMFDRAWKSNRGVMDTFLDKIYHRLDVSGIWS